MKINVHAPHSEKNDDEEHYSNHAVSDMHAAPHDLDHVRFRVNMAFQLIIPRLQSFLGRRQVFGNFERFIKRDSKHFANRSDCVNRWGLRCAGEKIFYCLQR